MDAVKQTQVILQLEHWLGRTCQAWIQYTVDPEFCPLLTENTIKIIVRNIEYEYKMK